MNRKIKTLVVHVSAIMLFITYETFWAKYFGSKASLWEFFAFYILYIFFFYFNALVVVENALKKDKTLLILFPILILEFIFYCFCFLLIAHLLTVIKTGHGLSTYEEVERELMKAAWRGTIFFAYSFVYSSWRYRIAKIKEANDLKLLNAESERKRVELENRMLLAENALLEAQIKEHLLFNTLSYVYDKTMDLPGGPGEAVLILNDVMRYSLKKVQADGKMPLIEEIEHIKNIVRLGELRHDEGLFINITTENVDDPEYRIIASMLSTFIENMFKYGDLKDPITPATISARVEGNTFSFRATNKKAVRSGQISHKIGLDNVRRRLEYAYDQFSLIVNDTLDEFIIDLKVPV